MIKYLFFLIFFLLLFILFIRVIENKFIFFPFKYPQGYWHPEAFGLQAEDCYFQTSDGLKLHGWLVKNEQALATLLWFHGNAGNITDRLDNLARLARLPLNVFIFDYRGYGRSQGSPDEPGIYLDAEAAYDFLVSVRGVKPERLILFGRSLGGAVAVDLAAKRPCAGLILESTFTSAKDMAKASFGPLPIYWFIKTRLNSIDKIKRVHVPVLIIHGNSDHTVPIKLGKKLFEAANPPKEFYAIEGADHNDTYVVGGEAYFQKIVEFIKSVVKQGF